MNMEEKQMTMEAETSRKWSRYVSSVLGNMQLWLALSLVFVALQVTDWIRRGVPPEGSPLWFLDSLRTIMFLIGISLNQAYGLRERLNLSRRTAVVLFLVLSWMSGMAFELTLTNEGSREILLLGWKYFIQIQAGYLPLTILGLLLIWRFHYTIKEVFFAGALTSLYEIVVQGIAMMREANPIVALIVVAYYMIAYNLIICWPLIIIDEKLLWDARKPKVPSWAKIALGIPLGILNMLIYAGWGTLVDKLMSASGNIVSRSICAIFLSTLSVLTLSGCATTPPTTAAPDSPGRTTATPAWESLGPGGGYFTHFLFDPAEPKTILACGDDCDGIWKSADGGDTWRLVTEEWRNVTAWEVQRDPYDRNTLYSVDIYGRHPLLKSTDGGETWEQKWSGITHRRTHSAAIVKNSSGSGSTVLVGTMLGWSDNPGEPDVTKGGLFKSTDGGESWRQVEFVSAVVGHLRVFPDGRTVLAGTSKGLYRSSDGGETWTLLVGNGLPEGDVSGLTITPDGVVYAAVPNNPGDALYRSDDNGEHWRGLGLAQHGIWDIIIEPGTDHQTIYCGTLGPTGVVKTTDGGKSWKPMNNGISSGMIICLAQNSNKDLFCSTYANEGILRSTDGAESWHSVSQTVHAHYPTRIVFDPNDPARLVVAAHGPYNFEEWAQAPCLWEGRLARDGRVAWQLNKNLKWELYAVAIPKDDSNKLLLGTFGKGVLFSKDRGAHFEPVFSQGYCTAAVFDTDNPEVAVAAVNNVTPDFKETGKLIVRTEDGGQTWTRQDVDFYANAFVTENGSDRIWAATEADGVYLSEDNGKNWQRVGLAGQQLLCIAQDPARPDVLYAGGEAPALHKSVDGGRTWAAITHPAWCEGADVRVMVFDPENSDRLYVGLNGNERHLGQRDVFRGGLWTSPDGGTTWQDLSGTLHEDGIWDIKVSPDAKYLYVATYGAGIQRLRLGEGSANRRVLVR
jgi:photosystem II stability/assembly factor-like uncharacterized protein